MDEQAPAIAASAPPTTSSATPLRQILPSKRARVMARLWTQMGILFGESRWLAHASEDGMDEWARVLGSRTLGELASGLGSLEDDTPAHPLGAGEFNKLCRGFAVQRPSAPALHGPPESSFAAAATAAHYAMMREHSDRIGHPDAWRRHVPKCGCQRCERAQGVRA